MNYFWLNKERNKDLIIFMNGWGMDEEIIKHLDYRSFDILMINDYRSFDNKLLQYDFKTYNKKYLICWSMGVYIAGQYSRFFNQFNKKIAIAGTQKAIDNIYGIPDKIYNYTIKHFSPESADKFIKNMFLDEIKEFKIKKNIEDLKEELISIQNFSNDGFIEFDKVIIPKKDIIIPYKNQLNYWKNQPVEIVELNAAHYVFNHYASMDDIIC